jgi:hypothetical protein
MFGYGGYFGHTFGEVHRDMGVIIEIDSSTIQLYSDSVQIVRGRLLDIDDTLHTVNSTEVEIIYAPRWREDPIVVTPWNADSALSHQWIDTPAAAAAQWQGNDKDPQAWTTEERLQQAWSEDQKAANNWQPGDEKQSGAWSQDEKAEQAWNDATDKPQSPWSDSDNSQKQQWSKDNSKPPTHWQQ